MATVCVWNWLDVTEFHRWAIEQNEKDVSGSRTWARSLLQSPAHGSATRCGGLGCWEDYQISGSLWKILCIFNFIYVFFPSLQVKDDLGYRSSRVFHWYNDKRKSGRERRIPTNWGLNFAEEKCDSPKKMVGKCTFPFYLMAFLLVVLWSTHTKQRIRNLGLVESSLGLSCWNSDCFLLLLLLYKWKEKKEKSQLRYGKKKINLSPFSVLIQSTYTWLIHIMAQISLTWSHLTRSCDMTY